MPGPDLPAVDRAIAPLVLDVEGAAVACGVCPSVVRAWIDRGWLATVKFPSARRPGEQSRRVLIAVSDLESFVARHRETSPAPNAALSQAAVRRWRARGGPDGA